MTLRIAVLTDLHLAPREADSPRRGDLAELLLARAVRRWRRWVQPDLVVLAGDLVEPGTAEATQALAALAEILRGLDSPVLAIPGNHDVPANVFYRHLPPPGEWIDVKGVRFVPFEDPEEPDFNARRTGADLERMRRAAEGFDGPLVTIQHVPLFPPDAPEAAHVPYGLVNASEVIRTMRECGYVLSLAGHFHEGFEPVQRSGQTFVAAPAVCKAPFPYLLIEMEGDQVHCQRQALQMPPDEALVDCHIHTEWAYCSENMRAQRTLELAGDFGLAGTVFTEHASHLYFSHGQYKSNLPLQEGIAAAQPALNRFDAWLERMDRAGIPAESVALEVDCDFAGRLVLLPGDERRAQYLMGSVHQVPASMAPAGQVDVERLCDEFLANTASLVRSGIRVLAHPFRVFQRKGVVPPERLYDPVVDMLREHGVAAEINFHKARQDPAFFDRCLRAGVRLTLGSDAHHLSQVGELWPHLQLLGQLGVTSNYNEVLLDPRRP